MGAVVTADGGRSRFARWMTGALCRPWDDGGSALEELPELCFAGALAVGVCIPSGFLQTGFSSGCSGDGRNSEFVSELSLTSYPHTAYMLLGA
jgi:hypothetical protein